MPDASLPELDLDSRDFRIYKTLLKLGPSSIRSISSASGINRGTTHEILGKLIKRGLVNHQPTGKSFHYQAEPPQKLLQLVSDKKHSLSQLFEHLSTQIIPQLSDIKVTTTKPTVSYYEDAAGVEQVLKDVLRTVGQISPKEYYVFSTKPMRQYLYLYFPNFTNLRVRHGISVKAIALGEGGDPAPLSERKWLPHQSENSFLSYIIIYAHKLALISLTSDDLPYAVVIEEPGISETMKFVFHSLWQQLKT